MTPVCLPLWIGSGEVIFIQPFIVIYWPFPLVWHSRHLMHDFYLRKDHTLSIENKMNIWTCSLRQTTKLDLKKNAKNTLFLTFLFCRTDIGLKWIHYHHSNYTVLDFYFCGNSVLQTRDVVLSTLCVLFAEIQNKRNISKGMHCKILIYIG